MNIKKQNPQLAFCGMMASISVLLALMMNVLRSNTLILLLLMSLIICIVTQRVGVIYAFCTAAVTAAIMLLVTWNYAYIMEYVLLFGTYPAIKYILEDKIKSIKTERMIKLLYFFCISVLFMLAAVYLFGGTKLFGEWFSGNVLVPYVLIAAMTALAMLYDIILTRVIYIYNRRFGIKF